MSMDLYESLQYAVIGGFVGNAVPIHAMREIANGLGLESRHFSNPKLAAAFDRAMALESNDHLVVLQELRSLISFEECEKAAELTGLETEDCAQHVKRLIDVAVANRVLEISKEAQRLLHEGRLSPEEYAARIQKTVEEARPRGRSAKPAGVVSAKEFIDSYDPELEEKNRLFAGDQGRWLAKEGALLLASTAGAGKSVLATQMGLSWACGKPCLGIVPVRPLKVGIFQTEDDNATMRQNIMDWRKAGEWSDADFDLAAGNFDLCDTLGLAGDAFIGRLAEVHRANKYDLVIINPLQGVCAGTDIAKNADLTKFLREGLDSVIKGRRPGCQPCGLVLVHHTNKPAMTPRGYGVASPQFLEYACAGGAEIANWMRAMLLVLEDTGKDAKPGHYSIIAPKKGNWLGWPTPVGKRPMKRIRHHDPAIDGGGNLMYWHEVDDDAPAAAPAATASQTEADSAALATAIAKEPRPPSLTEARQLARRLFGRARADAAYGMVTKDSTRFGLEIRPGAKLAQKFIWPLAKH